jgi:Spy/CpxP family protein refolding chaperone
MFAGLELTGEQREKIAKIMEEARRQAREAGEPDARRRIYADAQEKIADEVLTPQQREKLQQLRKEARERLQRERGQAPRAKDQPKAGSKTEPVIVD